MQQAPLMKTKLYLPPIRRELVPRPRLIERLNAGPYRKLTLVAAPAGFGKTTLVSEEPRPQAGASSKEKARKGCRHQTPADHSSTQQAGGILAFSREWVAGSEPHARVARASLDEGDNHPARFLANMIAALRTVEAGKVKPVKDRSYPSGQIAEAFRYVEKEHIKGNV